MTDRGAGKSVSAGSAAQTEVVRGLRDAVTRASADGSLWKTVQAARSLLEADSGTAGTLRFLARIADAASDGKLGLRPFKLALLSSFSIEFTRDAIVAAGLANGLRIEVYCGPFGSFRQEIHDPGSGLYRFEPQAVVLAVEPDWWLPDTAAAGGTAAVALQSEIEALLKQFRERSSAAVLCHNFAFPRWPAPIAASSGLPLREDIEQIAACNASLRSIARANAGFFVVDYAAIVARHGYDRWFDDRMRHYARAPIAQTMNSHLAREYLKFVRGLVGLTRKCLVVDLDNTLWGGILGEDGIDGVKLGPDYPGSAFVEFQRYIAQLQARGTILAIASKNNPGDVEQMFAKHPFMGLKPDQFSSRQVGWQPKSESLAAIAKELNIGLEHLVFVDDSPFECEHVREVLPQVTVIQLPAEPTGYIPVLAAEGWFDALAVSEEDLRRAELYKQRQQAESMRGSVTNLEDFYRDLRMELAIATVNAGSLKRSAQLTQKTNQFNVTTRRYTEADVERMIADPTWSVCTVSVRDKFGDNGIVGLMFAVEKGDALEIDTFLLSCRVIGRTVETAMLACLSQMARGRGLRRLTGEILPTAKNVPVRDLYARHGFQAQVGTAEKGGTAQASATVDEGGRWDLAVSEAGIEYPSWFTLEIDAALTPPPAGVRRSA